MSDIRERVKRFLKCRPDLSVADLTTYTELAPTTGRAFVHTGQVAETPRIRENFERVLRQAERGEILAPGGAAKVIPMAEQPERVRRVAKRRDFYQTATAEQVGEVLDYCAEQAAIGVITGDFGVGKTEAVSAWRRGAGRKVETLYLEFDSFTAANKLDFIAWLAEALGVPTTAAPQLAGRMFRGVVEKLRQAPCLLIFDQCEMVRVRVFQIIRQIWDRTHEEGVGVVMLAAPILLSRMKVSRTQDLGALTSRVGVWAPLAGVTRPEMVAIVKQEGVKDVAEDAFELWWEATGGSMRRLMAALDLIRAKHAGRRVTEKTIAGVAGHLWGMKVA